MRITQKVRLSIADDHPVFREGLKQIIEEEENVEVIYLADNGADALNNIIEGKPDIAILDIDMPELTGLEVLKKLKEQGSKSKVVFLTVYADEDLFDEGMEHGLLGYVLKDSAISEINECIYKVSKGDYFISPKMSDILMKRKKKSTDGIQETLRVLTPSERQILKCVSEGLTTKAIAEMLGISFKTVENHRTNISNKLNLKGANSLIDFAISNKDKL